MSRAPTVVAPGPRLRRPGRASLALLGVLCLATFVALVLVGVRTHLGQRADAAALSAFVEAWAAGPRRLLASVARTWVAPALALVILLLAPVAAARGRRVALLTAVALPAVCAPVALYVRDQGLVRPDLGVPGYTENTFPSVHATAALALLVGVAVLWPRRWDALTVWGFVLVAVVVVAGNVSWYDHRPVDVAGSALLVAGTFLLWVALVGPARVRAVPPGKG